MSDHELKERRIAESRTRLSPAQLALLEKRLKGASAAPAATATIAPRKVGLPVELSFAQQRMWFLNQLEPDNPFYNISIAVEIKGVLCVGTLERAANEVVRRHEALRTSFQTIDRRPMQVIAPELHVEAPLIDLKDLQPRERRQETQRLINEEAKNIFNLSASPLMRLCLLQLNDAEHVVSLVLHHIVSDGWSMGLFVREMASLYDAYSAGLPSLLKDLPVQYADFAIWQKEWLEGPDLQRQQAFWMKQLAGAPPVLQLPTDRPRPAVQTFRGASHPFDLSVELSRLVKAVGQQAGVSSFMILLAGLKVLLHRYTQETDLVIGSPFANRVLPEVEELIGFFVNTLVLRTKLSGEMPAKEAISRIKETVLDAHANGDLPFEKLVEEMHPERTLSHAPLFQIMLAMDNTARGTVAVGDLTFNMIASERGTAIFDLSLMMEEGSSISGTIEYNTDMFDRETVARLAGHYRVLLEDLCANPDKKLADLEMLLATERRQLLEESRGPEVSYETDALIGELFCRQVEQIPEAVAVEFQGLQLSYAELNRRANRLGHYLRSLGVQAEVPVGICMHRAIDLLVGVLGILKAGGAYVPLDPAYPQHRLHLMLAESNCGVLLTQQSLADMFSDSKALKVCVDALEPHLASLPEANFNAGVAPGNLAYIIYTSGSTGTPKGVALSHGALSNLIAWQLEQFPAHAHTRALQFTSLSFDVSFQEIASTLCSGGVLVLISEEVRRDPAGLLKYLQDQAVERLFLPFVALQYLAIEFTNRIATPASIREVITAGEQLQITPQIRRLFSELGEPTLENQYGPSESHVVTAYRLEAEAEQWMAFPPIGRPISNTQIYLFDARLQPAPCGISGELYIGGANLGRGYYGRPDLTAEKFVPDAVGASGARLYRTGDRARYRSDGEIEFLGRGDGQVKIRGYRIELREIEAEIERCASVKQAVVVVREEGEIREKRLVGYVEPGEGTKVSGNEIRQLLKEKLPGYMIPGVIVALDKIPLTASGKVDRAALPMPELKRDQQVTLPRTPEEKMLRSILQDLLRVEEISIHDSFFDLGGHSLLATQAITRLREAFKVELPLRVFFDKPTIAELAAFIGQEMERGAVIQVAPIRRIAR